MRGYTKLSYAWPTTPSHRRTSGSHNVHARRANRKVTSRSVIVCQQNANHTHTPRMPWSHTHSSHQRRDTEWLATSTSQYVTHSSLGMSLGESSRQPRLPFARSVQGQTWWMRVRWLVTWSNQCPYAEVNAPHAMKQATKRPETRIGATGMH
jgi:hypothetical protein